MKALVLHGNQQTGELFRTRIESFVSKCPSSLVSFTFPDGPVELEKLDGDDLPKRSWWRKGEGKPFRISNFLKTITDL